MKGIITKGKRKFNVSYIDTVPFHDNMLKIESWLNVRQEIFYNKQNGNYFYQLPESNENMIKDSEEINFIEDSVFIFLLNEQTKINNIKQIFNENRIKV